MKPDTFGSIFPTTPRQKLNPQPLEGPTNQIPHSPGTEHSQMPGLCPGGGGGGMLRFRFDRRIMPWCPVRMLSSTSSLMSVGIAMRSSYVRSHRLLTSVPAIRRTLAHGVVALRHVSAILSMSEAGLMDSSKSTNARTFSTVSGSCSNKRVLLDRVSS